MSNLNDRTNRRSKLRFFRWFCGFFDDGHYYNESGSDFYGRGRCIHCGDHSPQVKPEAATPSTRRDFERDPPEAGSWMRG